MNRTIILLSIALNLASCANAQIANITSNDTTELPAIAANIAVGDHTVVVAFDAFTVVMGKTWNCLAIYSATDSLVYWGDGETFMLDTCTIVCVGTDAYAKVDIRTGHGTVSVCGTETACAKPWPADVSQK